MQTDNLTKDFLPNETMPDLANRRQVDVLFSLTYEELRRLASAVRGNDPCATLTPTALVHEVWLKLAGAAGLSRLSRLEFKRLAAYAMRQLLVEAARRRNAQKRGGGHAFFVALDDSFGHPPAREEELITLDSALEDLARMNHRQAQIVELRFYGGFEVSEAAELLGVSETTIHRDWKFARAWLAKQLRRD